MVSATPNGALAVFQIWGTLLQESVGIFALPPWLPVTVLRGARGLLHIPECHRRQTWPLHAQLGAGRHDKSSGSLPATVALGGPALSPLKPHQLCLSRPRHKTQSNKKPLKNIQDGDLFSYVSF